MRVADLAIGTKLLVTTEQYFIAPNGRQYRAVFGTIKGVHTAEIALGIKPNGRSTNWYLQLGEMTIAGCQIHYVVRTDRVNQCAEIDDWTSTETGAVNFKRPNVIFNADDHEYLGENV